jgi:hypothetical protein
MSTSYVKYGGNGFWSWDGYLEDALALLADASGADDNPDWLKAARQHWTEQASGAFIGWIHPNLDEFLTTGERRHHFLRIIESALGRIDLTPEAKATLEMIASLVRGEIRTDASSPLDYVVSGEFRRMRK